MDYNYTSFYSSEDGGYVGVCSAFPLLSAIAATQELAEQGIRKLVAACIADMLSNGESIPP